MIESVVGLSMKKLIFSGVFGTSKFKLGSGTTCISSTVVRIGNNNTS